MKDMRHGLDWFESKNVFSCLDLKDVFYQVLLEPDSSPLTAIRAVVGILQYARQAKGLKNSPGTL